MDERVTSIVDEMLASGDINSAARLLNSNVDTHRVLAAAIEVLSEVSVDDQDFHRPSDFLLIIENRARWIEAKEFFRDVRKVTRRIQSRGNEKAESALMFEENVLKMLYNQTSPDHPFDDDVRFWAILCLLKYLAFFGWGSDLGSAILKGFSENGGHHAMK